MDYELRFQSLRDRREVLAFPCDESGRADMDTMDAVTRDRYLYARALVGSDYAVPRVERLEPAMCFEQ
jgi:hypothetical protein